MDILPVFPLPNTVFFPTTLLSLHIFEPRYRAMVRDVTAGEGLIVVSLMLDKDFYNLGTVGRVCDVEPLEDGRFNLRLDGLERVSLTEVPCDTPYRQVQIEARPEQAGTDDASVIAEARLELLATYGILRSMVRGDDQVVLHEDVPFEVAVNRACVGLPVGAILRQELLAEDSLLERQRLALDYVSKVIDAIARLDTMKDNSTTLLN